jgi:serine/threonine-protein kinase
VTQEPTSTPVDFLALQTALAGRYSLERELGRGGMGIVYLAREVALDRMVALKLLPPEMAARPGVKERFLREARTAARLSHPNIVPIYTVDEVDDFVFFAMAYVEGGTLGDRIRDRGPLSSTEAVRLLREVSWALGHAHLQGVVHRDVKPDNILLEEGTGRAMVTDFGIAALAEEAGEAARGQVMGRTEESGQAAPGHVMGTAEFMSPEQARGGEVDARSDLYSLACVGYYALSGQFPFDGSTPAAILGKHLTEAAPPVAKAAPHIPPMVATALDRCLRKEPERRFSGGEALADAILPDLELDKELPVPLRVFIKQTREFESTLSWAGFGVLVGGPTLIAASALGVPTEVVLAGSATLAGILGGTFLSPVRIARRLLRSGFTREDGTTAILRDIDRREEEFRFEVGQRVTLFDRILRFVKWTGLSASALTFGAAWVTGSGFLFNLFLFPWLTAIPSALWQELRARVRGDIMGERWLRFWKSLVGKAFFKLGGIKLKRVAAAAGIHRPTEIVLGLAADRLYEELPKETRKTLRGLPETVKALEEDAQSLRRQIAEMEAVLAEIGDDDPTLPSAQERAQVRANVELTRGQAQQKLKEAVAALETIRLGLLRMHAGSGTVESLTMELEAARELSGDMEGLLEGHQEVERILRERRNTGDFSLEG